MKIDLNKKYKYRNGEPARILCVDATGIQPVRSMGKDGTVREHNLTGEWLLEGGSHLDLIEIPEACEPREWEMYLNDEGLFPIPKPKPYGLPPYVKGIIRVREVLPTSEGIPTDPEPTHKESLTLEVGKWYQNRKGEKVGPLRSVGDADYFKFEHTASGKCWKSDGTFNVGEPPSYEDLIREIPAPIVVTGPPIPDEGFMFKVGATYETQAGDIVEVFERSTDKGYESLRCSDGRWRYDRSTSNSDAGRCTGTNHDYSYPHNFKRADRGVAAPSAFPEVGARLRFTVDNFHGVQAFCKGDEYIVYIYTRKTMTIQNPLTGHLYLIGTDWRDGLELVTEPSKSPEQEGTNGFVAAALEPPIPEGFPPVPETPGVLDIKRLWAAMPRDVQKKTSCHDLKRIADNYNSSYLEKARTGHMWCQKGDKGDEAVGLFREHGCLKDGERSDESAYRQGWKLVPVIELIPEEPTGVVEPAPQEGLSDTDARQAKIDQIEEMARDVVNSPEFKAVERGPEPAASYPPPENEWPEKPDPGKGMVWRRTKATSGEGRHIALVGWMSGGEPHWSEALTWSNCSVVFVPVPDPIIEPQPEWRELGPDEVIREGDELYASPGWILTSITMGLKVKDLTYGRARRRVTPEFQNPAESAAKAALEEGWLWAGSEELAVTSNVRTKDIRWWDGEYWTTDDSWRGRGYGPWAIRAGSDLAAKNGLGEKPIRRYYYDESERGHIEYDEGNWVRYYDHLAAIQALTGKGGDA